MKDTISWLVMRGQRDQSLEECTQRSEDLGRREHVVKVLLQTFRGAVIDGDEVLWVQPTFELRFKPEVSARPRRIDVVVSLDGVGSGEVISDISTKARGQLQERRFWQFFDAVAGEPIRWDPPKKQPLTKKGMVIVEISTESLQRHARSGPGSHLLLTLGAASDVDAFIDRAPLEQKDAVTFGWKNLEVITPLGTHVFGFHFGGEGRESAKTRVQQFAVGLGCAIATLQDGILAVSGQPPEVIPLSRCKAFLHDVLEDSLQRGGFLWREAFFSYYPDRPYATRDVATVTVQQSIQPDGPTFGGSAG